MATKAYMLVETKIGQLRAVEKQLRKLPGRLSVDSVTGPYDLILVIEADDLQSLGRTITDQVHQVPGIARTLTCLAVR